MGLNPCTIQTERQTDRQTDLCVEGGRCLEEELADVVHAIGVAGGVLEAGEHPAAHRHSAVKTLGHIVCAPRHREHVRVTSMRVHITLTIDTNVDCGLSETFLSLTAAVRLRQKK